MARSGLAQADDHIDLGNLGALRGMWQAGNFKLFVRRVRKRAGFLPKEMRVVGGIGVKIAFGPVHGNLAQQPCFGKHFQRVIDRCQRHRIPRIPGRHEQAFCRHMPVLAIAHQQMRQSQALARRAQPGFGKPCRLAG